MDSKGLYNWVAGSSWAIRIATAAVVVVWTSVVVAVIGLTFLLLEKPSQTLPPTPGGAIPTISLEPAAGPPGTTVSVRGEGWEPGSTVLVYLMAPGETQPPAYAVSSSTANAMGRITTGFVVPSDTGWENQGLATVLARATDSGAAAQAFFSVARVPATPTATRKPVEPTATMTATPTEEIAPTPTATPRSPTVTATTDLNIRAGPGMAYSTLGVLRAGQSAETIGLSADGNWWKIVFSGVPEGRGWVSAYYVVAENTENVTAVEAPSPPATSTPVPTPTPTPAPVVITDWRGEYFTNPHLSGDPVLVRNDLAISFDWGDGAPGPGVPADNFSARWSRGLSFSAGTYRFYTRVDDGVRFWIDGSLIIDQWHDSAPTLYSADIHLTEGWHSVRMEYYERTGGALAQLAWERLDQDQDDFPDWKAEYYDNRKLEGDPVLVRNEDEIDHNWGRGSPGSGVPDDNFSARWTREVDFDGGTYQFKVRVDDGVRLWVDDDLEIDSWRDGSSRLIEKEFQVRDGERDVEIEYFEREGSARIEVSWERKQEPSNQSPTAVINGPTSGLVGETLSFDGSGSSDVDGSVVDYAWDFGDGSAASGMSATHSYSAVGNYQVTLTVTDDGGLTDSTALAVQIDEPAPPNQSPTAVINGPTSGLVGETLSFDGSGSSDVDGSVVDYAWDFGDGSAASGMSATHSYSAAGDYQVTLTVTDDGGLTDGATLAVQIDEPAPPNQSPTAVINGPTSGLVGETLSFDGSGSSDVDGSVVDYAWDFGDGSAASGMSATHSYSAVGNYQVTLTVTDDGGLTDSTALAVQIDEPAPPNQSPTAVINGPTSGLVGETLSFDGSGSSDVDGSVVDYAWDFGDGSAASGMSATHSYSAVGNYQVTLTVTDDGGLTDSTALAVQIDEPAPPNQSPTAVINGPTSGLVGETLSFDGSGSSDVDGSVVDYAWDFGDGSAASGMSATHSYSAAGDYQVTLTVTDDGGLTDGATLAVQIDEPAPPNQSPTAVINGPTSGLVGETLSFDGSGSSDVDGSVVDYAWDFGDGSAASGMSATHSYSAVGNYQVTLTVTDDGGLTDSTALAVQIDEPAPPNQSPTAVINGPTSGLVGETLSFDGSGSSDVDGSVVDYAWDFGDGSAASGMSATHSYSAAGDYQVTLTVTDDGGLTDGATLAVQIDEPAPPNQSPTAVINGPTSGLVGETLSFDGSGSSDVDGSVVDYAWDFGDGSAASGVSVTHIYDAAGDYQVTLTVTDDGGLTNSSTHNVQVG